MDNKTYLLMSLLIFAGFLMFTTLITESSTDDLTDTPTGRPTVYDKEHCDGLWSYGTYYESRGFYGKDNVAMSDYRKNCT